jgi:hypothetical protein
VSALAADLRPLAHNLLEDRAAPPVLVLAAWHYLYGWHTDVLPELVDIAARTVATMNEARA